MTKEFYCMKDMYMNRRYFVGGSTYDEEDVVAGLKRNDKPQPMSRHMIQIKPKLKEKSKEQQKEIDDAIATMTAQANDIKEFGAKHPAAVRKLKQLEEMIEFLEGV